MISIQRQRTDSRDFIGVLYASEWFPHYPEKDMPYFPTDYVIGRWRELDKKIINMVIIAVCRQYEDALMIYDRHRSKYQSISPVDIPEDLEGMPGIKVNLNPIIKIEPSKKKEI